MSFPQPLNPFVGPRAFELGEPLFGRDREVRQLFEILVARRIILLHSPSGAGKTSLVQAGLIPRLRNDGFRVLPVVRLHQNLPLSIQADRQANRYIFSLFLSLEEQYSEETRTDIEKLSSISLIEYLDAHSDTQEEAVLDVLIIDQFEEILTIDPIDIKRKQDFFVQVGTALENPRLWALFIIREDYLGMLTPYVHAIPTHLSNTYRLDLLGADAAFEAIQKPARQAGVDFTNMAASKLVDDLRRTRIQKPDGTFEFQLGPYIEPVQLQVVCYRLWDAPRADRQKITEQDLAAFEQVDQSLVDQSLAEYYSQSVVSVATETKTSERSIREWFDRQLITEYGIRSSVLMGATHSGDLQNHAIQLLVDAHLVRSVRRGGTTWFELAHDRLINPVRVSNMIWREMHLEPFQRQARAWDDGGRPESLLLREEALMDIDIAIDELLLFEREFLHESREANRVYALEKEVLAAKKLRRIGRLAVFEAVSFILAVIAISVGIIRSDLIMVTVCGGGIFTLLGFIFAVQILFQTFQLSWIERRHKRTEDEEVKNEIKDLLVKEEDTSETISDEEVVEVDMEPAQIEKDSTTTISPDSEPKTSKKRLWIILGIVFIVLCCSILLIGRSILGS